MTNRYLSEAVNMQVLTTFRTRRQRRREAANKALVLSAFVVIALSYFLA